MLNFYLKSTLIPLFINSYKSQFFLMLRFDEFCSSVFQSLLLLQSFVLFIIRHYKINEEIRFMNP